MANDVAFLIDGKRLKLERHVDVFSLELFDDRWQMFVVDFIQRLSIVQVDRYKYPYYKIAVKLLFARLILPWQAANLIY